MKLTSTASVAAPPAQLFDFVSDIERVAACLPGARVDGREGDDYLGSMKVKVGPITGDYQGRLRFVELDREQRRTLMRATAEDKDGQGTAEAAILTRITEGGAGSLLEVETDLQIRGRVAQFGRGGLERLAERMFDELARNVEREMAQPGALPPVGSASRVAPAAPDGRSWLAIGARGDATAAQAPSRDALGLVLGSTGRRALRAAIPVVIAFGSSYLLWLLRIRREPSA
ncbi:MAG: SRPBCC family protein [Solirubrobacteraceae bacterium]|nr:SRPBCC family protein [Solirubrobacteraceae bacterium]